MSNNIFSLKREGIIQKLKSKEALTFVKKRLEDFSGEKLPETGVVGGGAVASAVVEFLNLDSIINPVYSDLDIFSTITEEFYRDNKEDNLSRIHELVQSRSGKTSSFSNNYSSMDGYRRVWSGVAQREKVLTSFTQGKINRTILTVEGQGVSISHINNEKSILSNFDINSTQVGFNLKNKELVFSVDFVDFLYTRELKVSKFNTPMQSLIRIVKKSKELGSIYFNYEENKDLCMAQSFLAKNQNKIRNGFFPEDDSLSQSFLCLSVPLVFGQKHTDSFFEYGLDEDFFLYRDEDTGLNSLAIDKDCGDKFLDKLLSTTGANLIKSGDRTLIASAFTEDYASFFKGSREDGLGKDILFNIVRDYSKLKQARKSLVSVAEKFSASVECLPMTLDTVASLSLNMELSHTAMIGQNLDELKRFDSMYKKIFTHGGSFVSLLSIGQESLSDILDVWENVLQIDKDNDFAFIGYLETHNDEASKEPLSKARCSVLLKQMKKDYSLILKENPVCFKTKSFSVTECVTTNELISEGKSQHHCVGGYSDRVKTGKSIIFSVHPLFKNNEGDTNLPTTIELSMDYNSHHTVSLFRKPLFKVVKKITPYNLNQAMNFGNARATLTPELVFVLNEIKKSYPFEISSLRMFNDDVSRVDLADIVISPHDYDDKNRKKLTLLYRVIITIGGYKKKIVFIPSCLRKKLLYGLFPLLHNMFYKKKKKVSVYPCASSNNKGELFDEIAF